MQGAERGLRVYIGSVSSWFRPWTPGRNEYNVSGVMFMAINMTQFIPML
jgi:hypothetical protein